MLVVDDNATNRRILEEMLANWRMRPTVVDGGRTALAALERARGGGQPFALVLLDAMMPEMDGFDLAAEISRRPGLAGATHDDAVVGRPARGRRPLPELGVAAYLTKPVKQSDLLDAILTALATPPTPPLEHARGRAAALPPAPRPLRILLAEDNPVNQRLAVRLLEKRGHPVMVAGNGRAGAGGARAREPFDLVLMDVQMPEMDGFEATAAIRERESAERGRHVPDHRHDGPRDEGDRERCLEAGMDGYVSKPIQAQELFQAIEDTAARLARVEAGAGV